MQWYYGEAGLQAGPVSEERLGELIASGRIGPATLLWREGMPHWLPLAHVSAQGGLPMVPPHAGYNLMHPTSTSGLAITSLVCGILSLVTCVVFLGIPAVICGHMAMSQIANSHQLVIGRGMALAGLICGYLSVLAMVSFVGILIFTMANSP
ncbi:MAG: DUF4190 domain-containing protein [Verrucomicrobiaceae bacterium]|nr:MAG: DUF4190 domain-containing protein [Verrucomicrobiaceae bacterium]